MRFERLDLRTYEYVLKHGVREHPALAELRAETLGVPRAQMQIGPDQGQFMQLLVQLLGARLVLELGTFTGYSSLAMALGLPAGGKLITCDIDPVNTQMAKRYWQRAGVDKKVELRLGPALETLVKLKDEFGGDQFDLAFIDADKDNYPNYFERCLDLVKPGGVILIDNVFMGARYEPGQGPNGKMVHELNLKLHDDQRVDVSLLPIGDGLTLARRRPT